MAMMMMVFCHHHFTNLCSKFLVISWCLEMPGVLILCTAIHHNGAAHMLMCAHTLFFVFAAVCVFFPQDHHPSH